MDKILSIDPSGTGTIQQYQPNILLYEDTNYIHKRTKDGLNLFRLLGAIECLEVERMERVNVLKVKELTKQLFKGIKQIENIEYLPGR
ncbi:4923_t:CDS:2, partial [Ambispora leptoticha]